jgi:DNA-binding MarR family transcriptional regulator
MARSRQAAVDDLGIGLQRYQRSVQAFDDAVGRRLRVGPADMRCLDRLSEGPATAGDLAAACGLRPAATTTLIDRLTDRGFVRRVPATDDRRRVLVELTEQGRTLVWAAYGPLVEEGKHLFGRMTVDELDRLASLLTDMTALTDRHRARTEADSL